MKASSLFETWAPFKRALLELCVVQYQLSEFLGLVMGPWSDTGVPQVTAVVAADGPGQA